MLTPNDEVTFKNDPRTWFYKGSEFTDNQTEVLMFETKDDQYLRLTKHEVEMNIQTIIEEGYHGSCCGEGC